MAPYVVLSMTEGGGTSEEVGRLWRVQDEHVHAGSENFAYVPMD